MDEAFRLFKSTREWITPVLTESAFQEKGMLTPDEFIRAGDHLVRTCPSWKWEAGDPARTRPYLPPDKQYLITRGVPCYSRCSVLHASRLVEEIVKGEIGDKDSDWCSPALVAQDPDAEDGFLVDAADAEPGDGLTEGSVNAKMSASSADNSVSVGEAAVASVAQTVEADDEYADMEDESLALDEAAVAPAVVATAMTNAAGVKAGVTEGAGTGLGQNLVRSRRYDVSITYDNYYRTPRIWLYGFDENGSGLSPHEVFQVCLTAPMCGLLLGYAYGQDGLCTPFSKWNYSYYL